MGRAPCCEKEGLRRGAWSAEEDQRLVAYIQQHGHPNWRALPKHAGLLRCGKSCRLRWINYLRPDIKRGNFTSDEEDRIVRLHQELGNRWSAISAQLPGRTDNGIKNVWHTHLRKRLQDAGSGGGRKKQARKSKPARKAAAGVEGDAASSPGRSSSGVTCSTATESTAVASSADNTATTSASQVAVKAEETESFSTAEFPPPIDESFWTWPDMMDVNLSAMDEELGLASSASTRDDDMEFWEMLLESGDMTDLSVM